MQLICEGGMFTSVPLSLLALQMDGACAAPGDAGSTWFDLACLVFSGEAWGQDHRQDPIGLHPSGGGEALLQPHSCSASIVTGR